MVRTLEGGIRASGGKSSRKGLTPAASSSSDKGKQVSSIGGNPVCPRETPSWQKPITAFLNADNIKKNVKNGESSTKSKDDEVGESSKDVSVAEKGEGEEKENVASDKEIEESEEEKDDDEVRHISKKIRVINDDSD